MRRSLIGLVVLAVLIACNDPSPTGTRLRPPTSVRAAVGVGGGLANIDILIAQWPKGLSNAIQTQWNNIVKNFQAGQTDAAKKKLAVLAPYILKKAPDMNPQTDESRQSAASRLVLYMYAYIYGIPVPDFAPGGDNAVGVLSPNGSLTLVTPSGWAGFQCGKGCVAEDRLIIITQDQNSYAFPCGGPQDAPNSCQLPLFYGFESIPGGALLKLAKGAVCHEPVGSPFGPLDEATHGRERLAHPTPATDLTPGSTYDGNTEILPLITQNFVHCIDVIYTPPNTESLGLLDRSVLFAHRVAARLGRLLSPGSAYAIDQGGGGGFKNFGSPFNNLDPAPTRPSD